MKHSASLLCIVWSVAAAALSCGGTTTDPQSGSESHFLGACATSSDCAAGLECSCGFCTRSCAGAAECASLRSTATCLGSAASSCSGVCVASCTASAECGALTCRAGTCQPFATEPPDAAPDADTASADAPADASADTSAQPIDAPAAPDVIDGADAPATIVCDGGACFCSAVATCAAARSFEWLPLGSRGWQTCGASSTRCRLRVFDEMEGGVVLWSCSVPFGYACTPGWPDTDALGCTQLLRCSVRSLEPHCPADLLSCSDPDGG